MEEKTRTPEIAVSTASSRTSSDAMTKLAQKESRATSETSSFVDDKEGSKSDVDEMSAMDKSGKISKKALFSAEILKRARY